MPFDDRETVNTLIRMYGRIFTKGEYRPEEENTFAPSLCNRIDRNTGGIVIAAKNSETLRIINEKIRGREIDKFYLCLVHGRPSRLPECSKALSSATTRKAGERLSRAAPGSEDRKDGLQDPGVEGRAQPCRMPSHHRPDPPDPRPDGGRRPPSSATANTASWLNQRRLSKDRKLFRT